MRNLYLILSLLLLISCQSAPSQSNFTIIDGNKIIRLDSSDANLGAVLTEAGLTLLEGDKVQFRGVDLPMDFTLEVGSAYTLQLRRSHKLTLVTPDSKINFRSSEPTIGQAIFQTGLEISKPDFFEPSLETPLNGDITINYYPSRDLTLHIDQKTFTIRSSSGGSVGQILGNSGFPLEGLDYSLPAENSNLPTDGQIKIVHVSENLTIQEKAIPFTQRIEYSQTQPSGEQKVIQAGIPGLSITRSRTRYEDGKEVSSKLEFESIIRNPVESIVSLGSKVQVQTISTPAGEVQYWRAIQMYTTSYSPCRSGTSKCSYGTASGMSVKHGVVALIPSLYNQLAGSRVYIPGYGIGVVGDVGGGFPDGRLWIDLGYSDDDYQSWSGYHTVYFLAPAPPSIPPGLN